MTSVTQGMGADNVKMQQQGSVSRFEDAVMPHLNAAYNLARWLVRNDQDAEDIVQEAYLRAFRFFGSFHGGDGRAWLLAIVRNTCRTWLQQKTANRAPTEFDEEKHVPEAANAETDLLKRSRVDSVRQCMEQLPAEYREALVLRELEELSYKQIAQAAAVPVGTIMSRLARARARVQDCIALRVMKGQI
jgi:RNA polymerase sigma-70 factor (ECF subfamily)